MNPQEVRESIPALAEGVYLNFGASGPSPEPVLDAAEECIRYHETEAPHAEGAYPCAFDWFDTTREAVTHPPDRDAVLDAVAALQDAGDLPRGLPTDAIAVEPPRDPAHGDMATNAAMALAKPAGAKPRDLAALLLTLRQIPPLKRILEDEAADALAQRAAALGAAGHFFEDGKARLQALARNFDVDLATPPTEHPSFIDGRTATVRLDDDLEALVLGLLLGVADRAHLRVGVGDPGHALVVDRDDVEAGELVGDEEPFLERRVRQPERGNHVADRVHAGDRGLEVRVHRDAAALVVTEIGADLVLLDHGHQLKPDAVGLGQARRQGQVAELIGSALAGQGTGDVVLADLMQNLAEAGVEERAIAIDFGEVAERGRYRRRLTRVRGIAHPLRLFLNTCSAARLFSGLFAAQHSAPFA